MLRTMHLIVLIFLVSVLFALPTLAANETPEPESLGSRQAEKSARHEKVGDATDAGHRGPVESSPSEAAGALPVDSDEPITSDEQVSYVDLDRDGVNDLFCDANGDGVNDVTEETYPHRFEFVDEDGDEVNDVFTDSDGDGVNDLDARHVDEDGDGICDNVIDSDGDGVNDITGVRYGQKTLKGVRFGRVHEETGIVQSLFLDEDGDGMHDTWQDAHRVSAGAHPAKGMDVFIDEDGDGICDGRTFMGRPMMGGHGAVPSDIGHGRGHPRGSDATEADNRNPHMRGKK